jgi:ESS family glutamate:Na+ symporter
MTGIVYHALAIGFIALALKDSAHQNKRKLWSTGMVITSTYALQGFLGILLVMLFWSDRFIGSGMLLALGFGQGPGLATSFGAMWDKAPNFMLEGFGVALGASYAFLGYLWGGIVGVLAINVIARKRGMIKPKRYEDKSIQKTTIEVDTVKEVNVMDGLTVQLVVIFIIYGLVWLTLFLFQKVLVNLGSIGGTIFGLLEGFNFIIGIGYALLYKLILRKLAKKGHQTSMLTNNYLLSNISSTAFNFMITGAVLSITLDFLIEYGFLLAVISTIGGIMTVLFVRLITKMVYPNNKDEYFVGLYGMLTGTASTGIALLKGLDPQLETPVAEELVLGSGTAITMALPLFGILMLPSLGFGTANAVLFDYIALFGCLTFVIVMTIILSLRSKKKPI